VGSFLAFAFSISSFLQLEKILMPVWQIEKFFQSKENERIFAKDA
jgi:hypothetical protein